MRRMFVFIAFSVLMLLFTSVALAGGGEETAGDQGSIASVNVTVSVMAPMQEQTGTLVQVAAEPIAGLSVNRFCSTGPEAASNECMIECMNAIGEYDEGQYAPVRRTWTRVMWTTSAAARMEDQGKVQSLQGLPVPDV